MDKELEERALKALAKQTEQYKRQNNFIKENYDRQTVTLPKGIKEKIKARGETVNGLVNRLLKEYLEEN